MTVSKADIIRVLDKECHHSEVFNVINQKDNTLTVVISQMVYGKEKSKSYDFTQAFFDSQITPLGQTLSIFLTDFRSAVLGETILHDNVLMSQRADVYHR